VEISPASVTRSQPTPSAKIAAILIVFFHYPEVASMQMWRFLMPGALGFSLRQGAHTLIDKISGAPARTLRARDYVAHHARQNDPQDVLRTLDRFALEVRFLMSVGPDKGPLIGELADKLPANARVLELGAYCGYSAIMIATALGSEARIVSIEIDADSVASASANVAYAGLSEQVNIVHGGSTDTIPTLDGQFDLVFLDHWKDLYLTDLQLIEAQGLLHPGSIVVADNVGKVFGAGLYLDYVRSCGNYVSENRQATIEYTSVPDAVEISVYRPD
jgi:catechol O-methyltransferase